MNSLDVQRANWVLGLILSCLLFTQTKAYATENDCKKAISLQHGVIEEAEAKNKGRLLKELSILYLKDQNQELAFESFLKALEHANKIPIQSKEPANDYEEALALYLKGQMPKETAKEILKKYKPILQASPKNYLLAYIVAIAHANLNQFQEFFDLFYDGYEHHPDHFLAFKTKAILHIKLMERKRSDAEKNEQRQLILKNFNLALEREPQDVTLYKLLIIFSPPATKSKQLQLSLNKIMKDNIIIPRSDIVFYVEQAVDLKEEALAISFLEKAREWYPQSRIISAAQNYIDSHAH